MGSKTDIANRALVKLGETIVTNIDTDSQKKATVLRNMWDVVRDSLLAAYPWNFAIVRDNIAESATAPGWGYTKAFPVPSDFLALLEIKDNPDYKIENVGGSLCFVTNSGSPLYIRYIRRVDNTGEFNALFDESFSAKLAYEACEAITQSSTKKQVLGEEFKQSIKQAYANNAIQEPILIMQQDDWINSREDSTDEVDYNL